MSRACAPVDGTPAWLFDGATFHLHDGSFSLRIVDRLKDHAHVLALSPPEVPQFLERAHGLLDRDTAASLMLMPEDMQRQTLLTLRWQGDGITDRTAAIEDANSGANWKVTPGEFVRCAASTTARKTARRATPTATRRTAVLVERGSKPPASALDAI